MFMVIESTPGYMPDADEPATFEDYNDAVKYANELADELEDDGFVCDRSYASSGNYFAVYCTRTDTVAPDLGRFIAVELDQS
jgi:hypothetical protein